MSKLAEYLSRKFILSILALAGSFSLAWYDKDLMGWVGAITTILAFYNGSNVFQDYLAQRKRQETPTKDT